MLRHFAVFSVVVALAIPLAAQAQDDLLAPLSPEQPTHEPKAKKQHPPKKVHHATRPEHNRPAAMAKTELKLRYEGPKDAVLYIDGSKVGDVPNSAFEIAPGDHTLVVKRLGYYDFSQAITAKEGQINTVEATLQPSAGIVSVLSNQLGATVIIDGQSVGTVPVKDVFLSPGVHDVVVEHEGFEKDTQRVEVKAGKVHTVMAKLQPVKETRTIVAQSDAVEPPPLVPRAHDDSSAAAPITTTETQTVETTPVYGRWYVWAGAAAVVAAGVTAGMIAANSGGGCALPSTTVCGGGPCAGVINLPKGCH